jgi:Uma2 family endonuclease
MSIAARLLTADEYARLPDSGCPTELVRGEVITMNPPRSRHGQVCANACFILRSFAKQHDLGHVLSNDSGVITERDPDTVRGADIAYYSYTRVPKGRLAGYLPVPPDVVLEVLSPDDRPGRVAAKVQEYLNVGVATVVVLDAEDDRAFIYELGRVPRELGGADRLRLSAISPAFDVAVSEFFE